MDYKKELNEKQYEAVTNDAQFLRIIAGAGSGKTRVLTYRISYLIEKLNINPYRILAITFTNKVAKEMKTRTVNLLPDYDLHSLLISTYHSFCARFLRQEIKVLGFPSTFLIMDDDDSLSLVKSIGESFGYKRTDDRNKLAMKYISNQKCYGKMPSDCEKNCLGHELDFKYFKEYEKRKNQMYQLDFDDLIIYTIKILESEPDIRQHWVNHYDHILIDEFQDTNDLQFKLLTLISDSHTNVYVVGDPDQTIYTWRGANQKIILNFEDYFSPTTTVILNVNYRSTANILNVANNLIKNNKDRYEKSLITNKPAGMDVVLKSFNRAIDESSFIANKIQEIRAKEPELKYRDFAILYRSSYLTQKLENVLVAKRIPYKIYGALKFYARAEVKDCLAYFKILMNEDDDISFERIINVPRRKIGDISLNTIKVEASQNNLSMIKYLRNIHKYDSNIKGSIIACLEELFSKMDKTRDRLNQNFEAYSEVLNEFINDIRYKDYLDEIDETGDKVQNVDALINDVRSYLKTNPESNFIEYLQNVTLFSAQDEIDDSDSVSLMTAHTAKGLEFNYVFLMGMSEGVFPNQRSILENPRSLEEERRLAYVACTRAEKGLYITYNSEYSYVSQSYPLPSRFLKEMGLKIERNSFNPYADRGFDTSDDSKKYRYDFDITRKHNDQPGTNILDLSNKNKIKWQVGDIAHHDSFGDGRVTKVEDDIIEVDFEDFGVKKLLGSHPRLSKKEHRGN